MGKGCISKVIPGDNHILRVEFNTGSVLLLDMSHRLDGLRFRPLKDPEVWNGAVTNGIYVRWKDAELSYDELLRMAYEEPQT